MQEVEQRREQLPSRACNAVQAPRTAAASLAETRPASLKVFPLVDGTFASEHRVAVREAPEAGNDVVVVYRVAVAGFEILTLRRRALVEQRFGQLHGQSLPPGVLDVLQGHVNKNPLQGRKSPVEPAFDALPAQPQGRFVVGEGLARAAMDIARELIEQKDEREEAARLLFPMVAGTGSRKLNGGLESRPYLVVEVATAAEPQGVTLRQGFRGIGGVAKPEGDNLVDSAQHLFRL